MPLEIVEKPPFYELEKNFNKLSSERGFISEPEAIKYYEIAKNVLARIDCDTFEYKEFYTDIVFNHICTIKERVWIMGLESLNRASALSVVFIHNHPNNNAFDYKDFKFFLEYTSLCKMIAYGNNGDVYFLTKRNPSLYFSKYDLDGFNKLFLGIPEELFKEVIQERIGQGKCNDIQYICDNPDETFLLNFNRELSIRYFIRVCKTLNNKLGFEYYPKGEDIIV